MPIVTVHKGGEVFRDEVADNTSFEVHDLDKAEPTRLPNERELELLRTVIDPKGLRDKEIR